MIGVLLFLFVGLPVIAPVVWLVVQFALGAGAAAAVGTGQLLEAGRMQTRKEQEVVLDRLAAHTKMSGREMWHALETDYFDSPPKFRHTVKAVEDSGRVDVRGIERSALTEALREYYV